MPPNDSLIMEADVLAISFPQFYLQKCIRRVWETITPYSYIVMTVKKKKSYVNTTYIRKGRQTCAPQAPLQNPPYFCKYKLHLPTEGPA